MKKKLFIVLAFFALALSFLVACNSNSKFKIGVILVGDETEGYSKAHMDGIEAARVANGLDEDQVIYSKKIEENESCATAIRDLVSQGCSLIISNSYGHQDYMYAVASENPNVTFVAATGDYAGISGLDNFKNSFTRVFESRYVSGVVAGMKIKELVEGNKLSEANYNEDGKVKVGYVGAFTYAEVISGYTAFFLGIQSVYADVAMEVYFTDSWFNIDLEANAAETLVNDGCVIIGQHADSTGAPSKVQSMLNAGKVCYSIGYNVDMLGVAPTAALTSATNVWAKYYTYAFAQAKEGNEIATNWAEGYTVDAVAITELGSSCASGTNDKVNEVIANIKNGTLHVFDTSKFTVNGNHLTESDFNFSYMDWTANPPAVVHQGETKNVIVKVGSVYYFDESTFRSAPYFDLKVDGITWVNK